MKLIGLLLLLMLALNDVRGELFTALVDMEQLLHAEHQVALHLRNYVEQQTRHLRQLLLYVRRTRASAACLIIMYFRNTFTSRLLLYYGSLVGEIVLPRDCM